MMLRCWQLHSISLVEPVDERRRICRLLSVPRFLSQHLREAGQDLTRLCQPVRSEHSNASPSMTDLVEHVVEFWRRTLPFANGIAEPKIILLDTGRVGLDKHAEPSKCGILLVVVFDLPQGGTPGDTSELGNQRKSRYVPLLCEMFQMRRYWCGAD